MSLAETLNQWPITLNSREMAHFNQRHTSLHLSPLRNKNPTLLRLLSTKQT